MAKEICELNLTVTDDGETREVEGHLEFEGTWDDRSDVLSHLFEMFEIEGDEGCAICARALSLLDARKKEEQTDD